MRTKVLATVVAGGLLAGAGLITAVISAPETARAREETDETEGRGPVSRIVGLLGDVLSDLVGDGTITQDQADAIVDAVESKIEEARDEHHALGEQLSAFLEDGVITESEVSELPDDHWLFGDAFDEAWEDGEVTTEELREANSFHHARDFRRGFHLGSLLDDGGIDQEEYDNLDDNHPLRQLDVTKYLEDGLITPDEFRDILSELGSSVRENA